MRVRQQQNSAPDCSAEGALPATLPATRLAAAWVAEVAADSGFARAALVALPMRGADAEARRLEGWIDAGYAGSMHFMVRRNEQGERLRARLEHTLPWARSAIVCWAPYGRGGAGCVGQETGAAGDGLVGLIARYARSSKPAESGAGRAPSDYHKVLLKRLHRIDLALRARLGEFESRAFVDTTPYSERALAVEAGLGWVGKNGCLIVPGQGSFGFLAVLFVSVKSAELAKAEESADQLAGLVPNRCGTCTRCLDACPTGALVAPGVVDARRCIASLTIEHKGPIVPELMAAMGNRVFGCDVCQEVCPWCSAPAGGGATSAAADPELVERPELAAPSLEWLGSLTEAEFEAAFNGSPVRRAGYAGLRRNVAIAMGNGGSGQHSVRLREWVEAEDEGLRTAARWALRRMRR